MLQQALLFGVHSRAVATRDPHRGRARPALAFGDQRHGRVIRLAGPLALAGALGSAIATLALGYGVCIVLDQFIFGVCVPGWATPVAGTMFLSGVQLWSIGSLGEYVGRTFDEVKQRPIYVTGTDAGRGTIDAGDAPGK